MKERQGIKINSIDKKVAKKPVEVDFFKHFKFLGALCTNKKGDLCFRTKKASIEKNSYDTKWWIYKNKKIKHVSLPKSINRAIWYDDNSLLLTGCGGKKEKNMASKGLPYTDFYKYDVSQKAKPKFLFSVNMDVEDVAVLPNGKVMFIANWDPTVEIALKKAKYDTKKAADEIEKTLACTEVVSLPFWENGGSYIKSTSRRIYVWEKKSLKAITDINTQVLEMWPAQNGEGVFFSAQEKQVLMLPNERLFWWEEKTGTLSDCTPSDEFRIGWVAVMQDTSALVAASTMQKYGLNQNPAFYKLAADKKSWECLYEDGAYSAGPAVSADLSMAAQMRPFAVGNKVYWNSTINQQSMLMCIDANNGKIHPVIEEFCVVHELANAGDKGIYISAMKSQNGAEIFMIEKGKVKKQITSFNTEIIKQFKLRKPIPLSVGSKDKEIHGFVLLPKTTKKKIPAILDVHGGPKTIYTDALFHEMQYWAERGYAVIYCNPRGSCGRGDAFADIRKDYGGKDADDVLAFLDEAIKTYPQIDEKRIGVTGGSYGGFMTNWLIGHTHRFAAAASQRSIANWDTMSLVSDIGHYFTKDQAGGDIWDGTQDLKRQSPIHSAHNIKTPTLFIHSDEDYRCPLVEGMQMAASLMYFGTPTKLCVFHGENHELSRSGKPQNRIKRLEEITQWFYKYMKP